MLYMNTKNTKVTKRFLILASAIFTITMFSKTSYAMGEINDNEKVLHSIQVINPSTALAELEEIESSISDESNYFDSGSHISNQELDDLLFTILKEESI